MVRLPAVRLEVLKLAVVLPPLVLNVPRPRLVEPSENVTTPVGLATPVPPGALTVTVAVKVTAWPGVDGLTDATTTVPVGAFATARVSVPGTPVKVTAP